MARIQPAGAGVAFVEFGLAQLGQVAELGRDARQAVDGADRADCVAGGDDEEFERRAVGFEREAEAARDVPGHDVGAPRRERPAERLGDSRGIEVRVAGGIAVRELRHVVDLGHDLGADDESRPQAGDPRHAAPGEIRGR